MRISELQSTLAAIEYQLLVGSLDFYQPVSNAYYCNTICQGGQVGRNIIVFHLVVGHAEPNRLPCRQNGSGLLELFWEVQ